MELLTTALLFAFITGLSGKECSYCSGGVRQGCCVAKQLHGKHYLSCQYTAVIKITGAGYGLSPSGWPEKGDCRVPMEVYNDNRMDLIYKLCNGESSCSNLKAESMDHITECNCGISDYEIIYFDCVLKDAMTTTEETTTKTTKLPIEETTSGLSGEVCPACTGGAKKGCCQWTCYGSLHSDRFCEDGAVIKFTRAEYGISKCSSLGSCCPVKGDCRVCVAELDRLDRMRESCNGKPACENLLADRYANIGRCNNGISNYEILHFDCITENPSIETYPEDGVLRGHDGEDLTMKCKITGGSPWPEVTWKRKGSNKTIHEGEELNIRNMIKGDAGHYVCRASNGRQNDAKGHFEVIHYEVCDSNTTEGITWPKTPAGEVISKPCVDGATVQLVFQIHKKITEIEDCPETTVNDTKKIAEKLEKAVGEKNESSSDPVKAGNLNASVEAALKLSSIHEDLENPPENDEVMAIVEICSSLIQEKNMNSWNKLLEVDDKRGTAIMTTLDNYAKSLAKVVLGVSREENITFYTKNIVFSSDLWKPEVGPVKYPKITSTSWSNETMDYITIDDAILLGILEELDTSSLTISSTYYRTLDLIVPNRIELQNMTDKKEWIGSKILAIEIGNKSSAVQAEISMELYFQNYKDVDDDQMEGNCNFWDFSLRNGGEWSTVGCQRVETDKNGTRCKCDHMTNFALLMSMYRPVGPIDKVLSVISIVGCSCSIFCMVVTMVVHALLWKPLKVVQRGSSSRSITTMALCAVLVIANIVFLAGVEKKMHKPLCITIAAFIHYLFLVAFGIMLTTGIQLYLKVYSLAHGMSTDNKNQLIGFLVAAFAIPLIIVGVTLAIVGPEHYISSEICWLSLENGVIFSFVGPIVLVVIINTVITTMVILKSIKSRTSGLRGDSDIQKRLEITKSTLWSIAVLTPIMGTTWIFGLFSVNEASVVFQFIFVILNSSQGVLIFIFSCLLDSSVVKARQMNSKKKAHDQKSSTMQITLSSND